MATSVFNETSAAQKVDVEPCFFFVPHQLIFFEHFRPPPPPPPPRTHKMRLETSPEKVALHFPHLLKIDTIMATFRIAFFINIFWKS